MGFFATFWSWLNGQLTAYIGDNTARLAEVLEPAVVTLATVYVMAWGYLHLVGTIEEPLVTGLKRIAMLALVLGAGLHLWMYNSLIVDTFYNAPAELVTGVIGSTDPVATIDEIWERGGAVAGNLWNKGGVMTGDFGYYLAGAVVWTLIGLLCVYAMFLISLSSIALAVLLALGPLFIASLLFGATRRFFSAWIAQLANFGLITLLTVMIAALLLRVVETYAAQTAARGAAILTVDALNMVLISVLVFLILRQVMPIASGLSGGLALSTFALVSRSARFGIGRGAAALVPGAAYVAPLTAAAVAGGGATVVMAAARSGRYVYGKASERLGALAKGWRSRP
jgi:type IV secretion system protein VirB6